MKIHFMAIGVAAMHNLAIALPQKGDRVTGSNEEIVQLEGHRAADEFGEFFRH